MVIAIHVVRRDVHYNRHVCLELIHILKLETRQLYDVDGMGINSHLKRETLADIAGKTGIYACLSQHMISKKGSGGLPIRSGDTDHTGVC